MNRKRMIYNVVRAGKGVGRLLGYPVADDARLGARRPRAGHALHPVTINIYI